MHSKTNVISTYEFQFDLIEHGCFIGLEVCHIKGGAKDNISRTIGADEMVRHDHTRQ